VLFQTAPVMIAFRRAHPILSKGQFYTDAEICWFNRQQGSPNWADLKCKKLACLIHVNSAARKAVTTTPTARTTKRAGMVVARSIKINQSGGCPGVFMLILNHRCHRI